MQGNKHAFYGAKFLDYTTDNSLDVTDDCDFLVIVTLRLIALDAVFSIVLGSIFVYS
jgi:hypothetical protein